MKKSLMLFFETGVRGKRYGTSKDLRVERYAITKKDDKKKPNIPNKCEKIKINNAKK